MLPTLGRSTTASHACERVQVGRHAQIHNDNILANAASVPFAQAAPCPAVSRLKAPDTRCGCTGNVDGAHGLEFDNLSEFRAYAQQLLLTWAQGAERLASMEGGGQPTNGSRREHEGNASAATTGRSSAGCASRHDNSTQRTEHPPAVAPRGEEVVGVQQSRRMQRPCVVVYRGGIYDVSTFLHEHPGGAETLTRFHGEDISAIFHDGERYYAHSSHAHNILRQFCVGRVRDGAGCDEMGGTGARAVVGDADGAMWPKSLAYPHITHQAIVYRHFTLRRDRGLLWQVMFLSLADYKHLINTPIFLPTCKLFDTSALEPFTKTPFWVVPLLWLPLSFYWFARGVLSDNAGRCASWRGGLDAHLYYPNDYAIPFYFYRGDGFFRLSAACVSATAAAHVADTPTAFLPARCVGGGGGGGGGGRHWSSHGHFAGGVGSYWAPELSGNGHVGELTVLSQAVRRIFSWGGGAAWIRCAAPPPPYAPCALDLSDGVLRCVSAAGDTFHVLYPCAMFAAGVLLWTVLEYSLHRLVFHVEVYAPDVLLRSPLSQYLHFVFHGIHHVLPMDPERLLFPPPLLVVVACVIYQALNLCVTGNALDLLVSGSLFGYVCYDLMHYSYHHSRFHLCPYMRRMKRHHMAHHYADDTRNFGVTTRWWDVVCRTLLVGNPRTEHSPKKID